MLADHLPAVKDIAKRIGAHLTEEEINAIHKATSFQSMSTNLVQYQPKSVAWRDESFKFVRKGKKGDYVNHFRDDGTCNHTLLWKDQCLQTLSRYQLEENSETDKLLLNRYLS